MDITHELLKKIFWYKPKSWQTILIPIRAFDEISTQLYTLDISGRGTICGIPFKTCNDVVDVTVLIKPPRNDNNERPIVPKTLLQHKVMGVLGYSMHSMHGHKKLINKNLTNLANIYLETYKPSLVITSTNWGSDLVFAYTAAKMGIDVVLTSIEKDNLEIKNYWDTESKLMIGELLTELPIEVAALESYPACKLYALNNCDYCVLQNHKESKRVSAFIKNARMNNKPILQVVCNE